MKFKIGNFEIGGSKTFIVAELSANHNQDINEALKAIKYAKKIGADAIKIQTFKPESLTIDSNHDSFLINNGTIWDGQNLFELYKKAYTPHEWVKQIFDEAKKEKIICFSSPFDFDAVDILEQNKCPAYKIASPEILHLDLIEYVAKTNKPIILSSGISSWKDLKIAVDIIKKNGNNKIAILKCTAEYPASFEKANLKTINEITKKLGVVAGLSDHTLGTLVPVLSVGVGAKIIEKHFIVDKKIGGVDSSFSLDKNEFKKMVKNVRQAEKIIGQSKLNEEIPFTSPRGAVGRSLYFVEDINIGEIFTNKNVRVIRPGYGVHPILITKIIGKKSKENYKKGTPISKEIIEKYGK